MNWNVFCPGGDATYYAFGPEALGLALLVVVLCTGSIIFFWSNLKIFLVKKNYSKKWFIASFIWVISMAILNVVTFMFFIKPTEQHMSGATSTSHLGSTIPSLVICVIGISILSFLIFRYTGIRDNRKEKENKDATSENPVTKFNQ